MNEYLCKTYLFIYREQCLATGIHEKDFTAAFLLIIIDSKNNFASWIKDSATISMEHQRFHPHCKYFSLWWRISTKINWSIRMYFRHFWERQKLGFFNNMKDGVIYIKLSQKASIYVNYVWDMDELLSIYTCMYRRIPQWTRK